MASTLGFENDKSADYESVGLDETEVAAQQTSTDDGDYPLRLPAKALPPRRSLLPFALTAVGAFFGILGIIILLHYLPKFVPESKAGGIGDRDTQSCDLMKPADSKLENAFIINLRSPQHLSFAEAKIVDVIWDLFVGQGGRLLMAWAAYRVFMDALVSLLEKTPVSYDLYTSLVFDTTSLLSTWKATKVIVKSGSSQSRVFMMWFSLATLYILAFPTLMGAATGYVNPSNSGYNMSDGNFVMASSSSLTNCFSLDHGALIGQTNETIVPGPQALVKVYNSNADSGVKAEADFWYLVDYNPDPVMSTSQQSNLEERTRYSTLDGNYTTNITLGGDMHILHNYEFTPGRDYKSHYCYDGKVIDSELGSPAQCITEPFFVWGFSSLLLQIILYLQIVWTFVMVFIWLHANMTSQLLFKNRKIRGNYRATADLAEALQNTLGDEYCAYSEDEIANELKRDRTGLRYYTADNNDKGKMPKNSLGLFHTSYYFAFARKLGEYCYAVQFNPKLLAKFAPLGVLTAAGTATKLDELANHRNSQIASVESKLVVGSAWKSENVGLATRETEKPYESFEIMEAVQLGFVRTMMHKFDSMGRSWIDEFLEDMSIEEASGLDVPAATIALHKELMKEIVLRGASLSEDPWTTTADCYSSAIMADTSTARPNACPSTATPSGVPKPQAFSQYDFETLKYGLKILGIKALLEIICLLLTIYA